jgi:transposase
MRSGKRSKRLSGCAALCQGKLIAPFAMDGYFDRHAFEVYVEKFLLPVLKKGQTVILDNASFHKSKRFIELIESVGCSVLFLPTYSPDLNPIEHYWFALKNAIRKVLHRFQHNLFLAIDYVFKNNCIGKQD